MRKGYSWRWRKLMEMIVERKEIPDEWRESLLLPVFKEKGDIQRCENYKGIKLMDKAFSSTSFILLSIDPCSPAELTSFQNIFLFSSKFLLNFSTDLSSTHFCFSLPLPLTSLFLLLQASLSTSLLCICISNNLLFSSPNP